MIFNFTLKSNHSGFHFESYAKLKFWNFQVGCAIILKYGIFQPNKNTRIQSFFKQF
jgi:hypothetical protein